MMKTLLGGIVCVAIIFASLLAAGYIINCAANATFLIQNMYYEGRCATLCICSVLTLIISGVFLENQIG